jgi:hypothetical protein
MKHVARHGRPPPLPLPEMIEFFKYIIDKPLIITIMREPMEQVLSTMYYFLTKDVQHNGLTATIETFPANPQCRELGITTDEELDRFIESGMDMFDLICVTEHFDECMVMLRRRMNWDMVDITYLRIHDAEENEIMYVRYQEEAQFNTEITSFVLMNLKDLHGRLL